MIARAFGRNKSADEIHEKHFMCIINYITMFRHSMDKSITNITSIRKLSISLQKSIAGAVMQCAVDR